jgi:hypothetical protein
VDNVPQPGHTGRRPGPGSVPEADAPGVNGQLWTTRPGLSR